MLDLKNNTPFAAGISVMPDEQGVDTLYIMVRAAFRIGGKWTLLDEQPPPLEADEYHGEPGDSSLKYPSDYHLGKPATDILVTGRACAPEGRTATKLDVSVSVGDIGKTVRVFGDREWRDGHITAPARFESMPLVYERAFGGRRLDEDQQVLAAEECNPVGTGFAGGRNIEQMEGVALPNLENPAALIQSVDDRPPPAGFGPLAPNWQPRAGYAGTYDEQWQNTRSPYLPTDFDRRFFNTASPDLVYPGYLQGGEPVRLTNMHPKGALTFALPAVSLVARATVGNRTEQSGCVLETVLIEPDSLTLSLTWRAAFPAGKVISKVRGAEVALTRARAAA